MKKQKLKSKSLRDEFAMVIIGGMAASTFWPAYMRGFEKGRGDVIDGAKDAAREAYHIADAMLAERAK